MPSLCTDVKCPQNLNRLSWFQTHTAFRLFRLQINPIYRREEDKNQVTSHQSQKTKYCECIGANLFSDSNFNLRKLHALVFQTGCQVSNMTIHSLIAVIFCQYLYFIFCKMRGLANLPKFTPQIIINAISSSTT